MEWLLRRENPDMREFILQALAKGPNIGIDACALRHALQLSPPQMAVLRYGFFARPLRRLIAEQPPFLSPCPMVVDALVQDVDDHSAYLSIHDVQAMVMTAAIEVGRRMSEDVNSSYTQLLQITMTRTAGHFSNRTLDNDPWLTPRGMGSIESHVTGRLAKANDVLPALLRAPARWLDMLLSQAMADVEQLPYEDKHRLVAIILEAYEKLLNQCFALTLDPKIEAGAQVIDRVLNGLKRNQFEMLLTMSRNWLRSNPPNLAASQRLAVLFLVGGPVPKLDDQIELLPSEIPPSLAPYTDRIRANVLRWKIQNISDGVLAKLWPKPTIDLT